jgi:hypothetical protein
MLRQWQVAAAVDSEVFAARDAGAQVLFHRAAADRLLEKGLDRGVDLNDAYRLGAHAHDCSHSLGDLAWSFREWPRLMPVVSNLPEVANHTAEPF